MRLHIAVYNTFRCRCLISYFIVLIAYFLLFYTYTYTYAHFFTAYYYLQGFLGAKSKDYIKVAMSDKQEKETKTTIKHKGINDTRDITYAKLLSTLLNSECHYLVNRQLKIDKFKIFTMDITKRAMTAYDSKRYYCSPLFSLPFFHPDIKVYEERRKRGLDVSMFENSSPPHYIPEHFWLKFTQNVRDQKYIRAEGSLFEDFNNNEENRNNLFSIFRTSFENQSKVKSGIFSYTGEKISDPSISSEQTENVIRDGIIFDSHQLELEREIMTERGGMREEVLPIFTFINGEWKEVHSEDQSNNEHSMEREQEQEQERGQEREQEHQIVEDEEEEEEEEEGQEEKIEGGRRGVMGLEQDVSMPGCSFWSENRNRLDKVVQKYDKTPSIVDNFVPCYLKRKPSSEENVNNCNLDSDIDDADDYRDDYETLKRKKRLKRVEKMFGFQVSHDHNYHDDDDDDDDDDSDDN